MKPNVILTITSLLSMLLFTFHLTDDIVRGFEPGGFKHLSGVLTLSVWLYGTLVLIDQRSGYIIIILGSLLGFLMPLAHMRGAGLVGGRIANSSGIFFWVWTLIALGVTALFTVILSVRGLWSLQRQARNRFVEQTLVRTSNSSVSD
jgi:hypothetical protein